MAFNPYTNIGAFYKNLGAVTAQCAGFLGGIMGAWNQFFSMASQAFECMQNLARSETRAVQPIIETVIRHQHEQLEIMAQAFDRYVAIANGLASIRANVDRIAFAIKESNRCARVANTRGHVRPDAVQSYLDCNRELVGICAKFDIQRYLQWINMCHAIKHAELVLSTSSINAWSQETVGSSTEISPEVATCQANLFAGLELPHGMKAETILYQEAYQESVYMMQSPDAIAPLPSQQPQQVTLMPSFQPAVSPANQNFQHPVAQNSQVYNPTMIPRSTMQQQHAQTMIQGPRI